MKLATIQIAGFRSIRNRTDIKQGTSNLVTLVGANNLGKSNVLRALNLFFNGEVEPEVPYNPTVDITQGTRNAVITVVLEFNPKDDRRMTTYIDKYHKADFGSYRVPLTLRCLQSGGLQYSFAGAGGKRKTLPDLAERIRAYVNCIYVPAIKDYRTILDSQMMRKIVAATFQGWGKGRYGSKTIGEQKEKFRKLLNEIQSVLDESGDYVSSIISAVVASIERFSFSLPYDNLESFLGRLLFVIEERHLNDPITLGSVGSGVQSFAIYSMLRLLHEIRPTNTYRKSKFLWLIEEPETFLHHDLQHKALQRLIEYSEDGHIFVSTHSPVFIDKSNFASTYSVTHDGRTTCLTPITADSVREVVAGNLGVAFEDFFPFRRYNILVEGETDERLLSELNRLFHEAGHKDVLDLAQVGLLPCGSAGSLAHFYRMFNVFNRYADFIALFDADPSGEKARADLINSGVSKTDLLLLPACGFKRDTGIEDLVDKALWDGCVQQMHDEGLVTLKLSHNQIVDYEYEYHKRVDVKKRFVELLLELAQQDLSSFDKYGTILAELTTRLKQKAT